MTSHEKPILTAKDRERLLPVVHGEYPTESGITVVEQIVREHLGKALHQDLG